MCGRYTLRTPAKDIARQFELSELPLLQPRYNIAPSQNVAAVRVAPTERDEEREKPSGVTPSEAAPPTSRELAWLRWGLVPPWSKDPKKGPAPINARAETVADKPLFRAPFRHRRCLVIADGYYEWKKLAGRKQPYYLRLRDGGPFALAGLWQRWQGQSDDAIESCTILTTSANKVSGAIHDRMPVILDPAHYRAWLDPELQDAAELLPLLRPYDPAAMVAEPVSTRVNSPRNDGPDLVVPIEPGD